MIFKLKDLKTSTFFITLLSICTIFFASMNSKLEYGLSAIFFLLILTLLVSKIEIKLEKINGTLLTIGSVLCIYNIFFAIDKEDAILGLIRVVMVFAVFIIFYNITLDQKDKIIKIVLISNFIIAIVIAIINLFSVNDTFSQIAKIPRLDSVIHYANTLALFMAIGIISGITIFSTNFITKNKTEKIKNKIYLFIGFFVKIILISLVFIVLWLTFSRTMWILTIPFLIAVLVFLKSSKAVLMTIISMIISLLGAVSIQSSALSYFSNRIASTNTSSTELLERFAYYIDSIDIIKDHFWTGTGVGGWENIQFPYQTSIYAVKFAHSSFFQAALDGGIIGLIIFVGVILLGLYYFIKSIKSINFNKSLWVLFFLNLIILVHSLIDFDFEFSFINIIFWMNNGIIAAFATKTVTAKTHEINFRRRAVFILILCIFLLIPYTGSAYLYSYAKLDYTNGKYKESADKIGVAELLFPFSADYANLRGDSFKKQYTKSKDTKMFLASETEYLKAQNLRKNYPGDEAALGYLYLQIKDYKNAQIHFNKLINLQPLVKRYYEIYSKILVACIKLERKAGNSYMEEVYIKKLLNVPDRMIKASKKVSSLAYRLKHKPTVDDTSGVEGIINGIKIELIK